MTIPAANEEPSAVCHKTRKNSNSKRSRKAELALNRQCTGSEQHRRGGQRNPELLYKDPDKEQKVAVYQQDVCG
jgi:hypothetical protein